MKEIKEALWNDYNEVNGLMKGESDVNSDYYKTLLEEKDKLRNELIKIEQIKQENNVKMSQIESNNNNEKIRNVITIGTFIVTTSISVYAIAKTFKFDQVATVTSTLGRNILNGVVPKMLKR